MSVVVDASLIVALVVADERQAAAQAHLQGWVESGEDLHAPAVLPYEVANVLARLVFDGDLEADGIADTWSDLAALDLGLHPSHIRAGVISVPAVDTFDGPSCRARPDRRRRVRAGLRRASTVEVGAVLPHICPMILIRSV